MNSSPYYAQANSQAKSINKILIKLIKEKINDNPRRWHETLSGASWAHRALKHGATKVTSFELVYRQEALLPVEINLQACRVTLQHALSAEEYSSLMVDQIDEVHESRLRALEKVEKEKLRVAKVYNKKVEVKSFQVGELVWKTILPVGTHHRTRIVPGNAYFIENLDRQKLSKAMNKRYLKKYHPSVWQGT
jgi:hypothetical protein